MNAAEPRQQWQRNKTGPVMLGLGIAANKRGNNVLDDFFHSSSSQRSGRDRSIAPAAPMDSTEPPAPASNRAPQMQPRHAPLRRWKTPVSTAPALNGASVAHGVMTSPTPTIGVYVHLFPAFCRGDAWNCQQRPSTQDCQGRGGDLPCWLARFAMGKGGNRRWGLEFTGFVRRFLRWRGS